MEPNAENTPWTRRRFLRALGIGAGAAAAVVAGVWRWGSTPVENLPPGQLRGPNYRAGHRLRDRPLGQIQLRTQPSRQLNCQVLIVGGGMAGLCAAWQLARKGITDIIVLELENQPGGNSIGGTTPGGTPYPWGAHYLPLPGPDAGELNILLQDLGLLTGHDANGLPIYDETALSFEPHDRLLINGVWQEGLIPRRGVPPAEQAQMDRFLAQMATLRATNGADGRAAFAIPIAHSTTDAAFRELDKLTMAQWLEANGYTSENLKWYVEYCCKDDYGLGIHQVSAWAGLHYFASRDGAAANAPIGTVLTWPQGNAWLAHKLAARLGPKLLTGEMVIDVGNTPTGARATSVNDITGIYTDITAQRAIVCTPQMLLRRIVPDWQPRQFEILNFVETPTNIIHTPWVVANITLPHAPEGFGEPPAWDNVSRTSPALGYVVANHQLLTANPTEWVLTYYWPLCHLPPDEARQLALHNTREDWARLILADFDQMHPGQAAAVRHLDVWVWGHGMPGPAPGALWNPYREKGRAPLGNLFFAHTDHSGISIFEEAFYQGLTAANEALGTL